MINLCIERSFPFGVVLIQQGYEAFGPPAEPYHIGCTARIIEMQPLNEGRMNIFALGHERFRTILLDRDKAPYLNGIIEPFPLLDPHQESVERATRKLKPWLKRYLEMLASVSGIELELPEIPDEPQSLAYLAAITLQVSNTEKQEFLNIERTTNLLERLYDAYRREMSILRSTAENPSPGKIGSFSVN